MNKIRVLHCLMKVGSGGVEQRRLSLARGLECKEFEQKVVCTEALGALPDRFRGAGCPIVEVGPLDPIYNPTPYKNALSIVRHFRPHIIHGAVYEGVALAAVCGSIGRVPLIIGEETSDPKNRSWKGDLLYRVFAGLCDHMIGVSPVVTNYLKRSIGLDAGKVTLINNGVEDKPRSSSDEVMAVRAVLGISATNFVIGAVGRLADDHKRFSDLIRAMPMVISERPEAVLIVVGSGPDEDMLRGLAVRIGVAGYVRFAGYQGNTQPYYEIMDLFVMASAHEAFGLAIVEAMLAEVPVVATRVGGIPGVVMDGVTGELVEPYRSDSLAESVLRLANSASTRLLMGRKGRERALALFTSERYVKDVDALYRRLLWERPES